jgi:hypothetical protein
MIWFGNLDHIVRVPAELAPVGGSEHDRMRHALERVAERAPHLSGAPLLDALAGTGWVDRATAERLLPLFRHFDADRHFADNLRRLSFRGRQAAEEFRSAVRCIVEELTGSAAEETIGPEPAIRFRRGEREGVVLAHPEVAFTIGASTRDAISSAVEEMPDTIVVVARNFDRHTAAQLTATLAQTGVPGTLVTVNLLLGIRATALRYQPPADRVIDLLGTGRPLRSADVARLGDRERQF